MTVSHALKNTCLNESNFGAKEILLYNLLLHILSIVKLCMLMDAEYTNDSTFLQFYKKQYHFGTPGNGIHLKIWCWGFTHTLASCNQNVWPLRSHGHSTCPEKPPLGYISTHSVPSPCTPFGSPWAHCWKLLMDPSIHSKF